MVRKKGGPRKGRPNQGQGPPGGRDSGRGQARRRGQLGVFLDDPSSGRNKSPFSSSGPPGSHGHSLADEARNTARRPRGPSAQNGSLRRLPVKFVSAGLMDPLKDVKLQPRPASPNHDCDVDESRGLKDGNMAGPDDLRRIDSKVHEAELASRVAVVSISGPTPGSSSPSEMFTVDVSGDPSLRPTDSGQSSKLPGEDGGIRHESDSSEEVILFKGRENARNASSRSGTATPHGLKHKLPVEATVSPISKSRVLGNPLHLQELDIELQAVEAKFDHPTIPPRSTSTARDTVSTSVDARILSAAEITPGHDRLQLLLDRNQSDEEAAIIADYIANTKDADSDSEEEVEEGNSSDEHPGLGLHTFSVLRDLGGSHSDAYPSEESEDDSSGESLEDPPGEAEIDGNAEIDIERNRRRVMELADHRMARMLAKQEELGLGTDEIVLFDDDEDDNGEGDRVDWRLAPSGKARRKKGSNKQARIIKKKGQFPSATQMADAFDELDLMDWHRPALNDFKRAPGAPEHPDSDLEEAMNLAYQKDRQKKAERKKQREQLRAQSLLGKSVDPADLRIKYPAGMTSDDLVFELEQFIVGDDEQLVLPPVDKAARRLVHLAGMKLGIKTQSAGKGNNRYPVLYRTKRTLQYDEQRFSAATRQLARQTYFARVDVNPDPEIIKAQKAARVKVPRKNAIGFREGDVVGQHASEIASGNKGRLLLEKMGWSKGMALGTGETKGLMVPIASVIKKTKAGLGEL